MSARFVYHPILANKKSRMIFLFFLAISFVVGLGFAFYVNRTVTLIGLSPDSDVMRKSSYAFLLSVNCRATFIILSSLLGASFTARHVVGPVRRLERWLRDWKDGLNPFPLLVRRNDKFTKLVNLLNTLYQKSTHKNRPTA